MSSQRLQSLLLGVVCAAAPCLSQAAPLASFVQFDAATHVTGAAPANATVSFEVALRMADFAGMEKLVFAQKVLTPAQAQAYLPTEAAQTAVLAWLRGAGVTIVSAPSTRLAIRASAPASVVAKLLGVSFVTVTVDGVAYLSADREPAVPASVAPYILGIHGLEPQLRAAPMLQAARTLKSLPLTVTGGVPPLYPIDLQTAYKSLGDGTGASSTTAIVIDTFPYTQDLTQFWSTTGVAQSLSNITFIQTVAGTLPVPSGEESLDVEQSSSLAPAGRVRVYASASLTFAAIDASYLAILSDIESGVPITQVSISLGACETKVSPAEKTTDDGYFATMALFGASVFVSSGDGGAQDCAPINGVHYGPRTPSFYATSPNVTAVGGTSIALTSRSKRRNEVAWQYSGGGISRYFIAPAWQQGLGYSMRVVPDVASDANPNTGVLLIYGGGQIIQVGGTSVSSPCWAGWMGLVNSARIALGKPTLGLLASRTIRLVDTPNLYDITKGTNDPYKATIGFDLVTGSGVPDMKNLQATLIAQP